MELADTIALLDHLQVARVAVIGTSRGGLVGMLMSAMHRDRMAGLMLNDIGSALDMEGLLRIRSYIGKTVVFENFAAAADMLKQQNVGFHNLADEAWLAFARRLFRPVPGGVVADYDPALAATFVSFDDIKAGRASDVRKIYSTTAGMPVSVLRGANSDLLSSATVAEMQTHNPDLDATTVADRGHAPFLDETESVAAISRWLQRVDENEGLR